MRVVSAFARTVRWPIASQGAARGRTERAAVILEVRSERGAIGLGEAAPLPGMSLDTLDAAERAIAAFARLAPFEVLDLCIPFALADRDVAYAFAMSPPAARFAIETAVLDALARERGMSIAAMLDPIVERAHSEPDLADPAASATATGAPPVVDSHEQAFERIASMDRVIPFAAVVDDPRAALRAWDHGIRCLKIKLAADDDPGRVFAIAAAVPRARLRIDANRSWPHAEVVDRLAVLTQLPIDYVEEPCVDAHLILAGSLPCKIALDESLLAMSSGEIRAALRSPQLAALVLKPTLLGGFSVVIPLAALARRFGVAAIVSHTLEGPIGTAACAELALALGGGHPAGLAAHAALAGWRIAVPQLAADHLHHAAAPGLGFVDLDLGGVVRA